MRRWRGKTSPQGSRRAIVHLVWSKQLFGLTTGTCTHVGKKRKRCYLVLFLFTFWMVFILREPDLVVCKRISLQLKSHESLHNSFALKHWKGAQAHIKMNSIKNSVLVGIQGINEFFWHVTRTQFKVFIMRYTPIEFWPNAIIPHVFPIAWWGDLTALFLICTDSQKHHHDFEQTYTYQNWRIPHLRYILWKN